MGGVPSANTGRQRASARRVRRGISLTLSVPSAARCARQAGSLLPLAPSAAARVRLVSYAATARRPRVQTAISKRTRELRTALAARKLPPAPKVPASGTAAGRAQATAASAAQARGSMARSVCRAGPDACRRWKMPRTAMTAPRAGTRTRTRSSRASAAPPAGWAPRSAPAAAARARRALPEHPPPSVARQRAKRVQLAHHRVPWARQVASFEHARARSGASAS